MPQYLLSTQTIVDIAKRDGSAPEQWLAHARQSDQQIDEADIFISAVSHAQIKRLIERLPPDADREALRQAVEAFVQRMDDLGQIVPVTKGIADTWGLLLGMSLTYTNSQNAEGQFSSGERLVMATAIKGTAGRPYVLVARNQAAYTTLQAVGLVLEDPYSMFP